MHYKAFDSFEEMIKAERKAREIADTRITSWQKKARSGDILISDPGYGFPIFHELLDNEKIVKDLLWKYGDEYEEEGIYVLDKYNEPHMQNYRFCRNYSIVCPEGELGDIHLSVAIYKVPRDIFEEFKGNGFDMDKTIETMGDFRG